MSIDEREQLVNSPDTARELDVERDSDVPISTQIYWQLAYQIDSGRLLAGSRLPPVRELGAALRVNPNTIRAVYRRLADAGYVTSRHGAGTHVADRPPQKRGAEALAGIVAEMLRRGAEAGFTPDEVASAAFAAATERKRPGALVQVLFAECTNADAGYDAERLSVAFDGRIQVEGTLLDDLPDRLEPVPLRPRRHDDVPRRRGPGARPRPPPGRRDARRAGLHGARPRDRGPARGLARRARLRVRAGHGEHGRDARAVRRPVASSC